MNEKVGKEQKGKWIGATVRLRRDIKTTGGVKFRAGTLMKVADSTSGGLDLYCYKLQHRMSVRGVDRRWDVDVVKWPLKEEDE